MNNLASLDDRRSNHFVLQALMIDGSDRLTHTVTCHLSLRVTYASSLAGCVMLVDQVKLPMETINYRMEL